ncbi:MAG: SMC family ATPase, partial [Clostridiales bacterium]|nr:SMC family ATPase [Clostridiales bacterium]
QNAFRLVNNNFIPSYQNPTKDSVNNLAKSLIGLNYKQFVQVMVLPQGQFESFLVADADEKEEILSTLFAVNEWQEIAKWLCGQASDMNNKNKEIDIKLKELLKSEDCNNLEELVEKKNHEEERSGQLKEEIKEKVKEKKELETSLTKSRLLFKSHNDYEKAKETYNKLESQKKDVSQLETEVQKNRRAAEIKPYYENCKDSHKKVEDRKRDVSKAEENLENAKIFLANTEKELEKAREEKPLIDEKKTALPILKQNTDIFERLENADICKKKADAEIKTISDKADKIKNEILEANEKLKDINKCKDTIISHIQDIPELSAQKVDIDNIKKHRKNYEEKLKQCEILNKKFSDINNEYEKSQEEMEKKKNQRDEKSKEVFAFLFAHELKEGQPCKICGSTHHPKPAMTSEQGLSEEDINNLDTEYSKLELAHKDNFTQLTTAKSNYESGLEKLKEIEEEINKLPKYSEAEVKKIISDLGTYEIEQKKLPQITEEEKRLQKSLENKNKELEEQKEKLEKESGESKSQEAVYTEILKQIENNKELLGIKDLYQLNQKISDYEKIILNYDKRLEECTNSLSEKRINFTTQETNKKSAESELKLAQSEYEKVSDKYKNQMEKRGFNSRKEFEPFIVEENRIAEKQKKIDDFKAMLKSSSDDVEKYEKEILDTEKPDVKALEVKISEKSRTLDGLNNELGKNQHKLKRLVNDIKNYEEDNVKYQEGLTNYERLNRFGRDLRGDNGVGLSRFVLGIMLENVVFEANRLLENIKGGQYRLSVNREEREGRKRKFGLDLNVTNSKASEPYSVRYLSGGEKFLVAVALSLSLSAVVQMQAGGIKIEALFIDEGFGSLDSTTLDDSMDVLVSVTGTRKMLGIISHVESMKETISRQILVTSDNNGSHLEVI